MISKERLNFLAREIGERLCDGEYDAMAQAHSIVFANALIKAVEAESEVVGYEWVDPVSGMKISFDEPDEFPEVFHIHPLIALPLIGE
jgi:hypothetical protein